MSGKTLHGLIRGEEGQSLVVALVLVSALTISIAGIITFMTSNEKSFGRDRVSDRALAAAEAGLANGVSRVQFGDPNDSVNALTPGTVPDVDGSHVSYTVTKNTATPGAHYWTILSTATYRGITRQVEQRVDYTSATKTVDVKADYDYGLFIGTPPAGTNPACLITLGGNVSVNANVWIGGNLCTNGTAASLTPNVAHTLQVYIKGYVSANGGGTIGTSALPFDTVNIVGGCSSGTYVICSSATNVWADHYGADISTLQKPQVDAAGTYALANWSSATCTGGFVLDDDTMMNRSANAAGPGPNKPQELFPNNQAYSCVVTYPDGYKTTIAWDGSSNFSVNTTDPSKADAIVFVDGDLTMTKPNGPGPTKGTVNWTGNGSIYVNGTVTAGSNFDICGPPKTPLVASGFGCAGSWDSTLGNVGLVILNPLNATYGFNSSGNGEIDFSMLIANGINNTGGTVVTGSVLADGGKINGGTGFFRPGVVTPGFPTHATQTTAAWNLHPGSWKQLK